MYLSIPDVFLVPVHYDEEDILNIKKIVILGDYNFDSGFTNKTAKRTELVIGLSFPSQNEEIFVRTKECMEKYAQTKGITVKVENADNDADKQEVQVENLIAQGIDVLILAPVDSLTSATMVEKAHEAGIKVLAFDRIIKNSDLDLYVSFDSIRVGQLQAQFLIRKVPKGNYIIMSGDPEDDNSKLFKEGAMNYIRPLVYIGNIKIVTEQAVENWDPKIAFKIVEDSLIANENKIDAILAPNDNTAGGAIQALQAKGLAGKIPVAGEDGDLAAFQRIIQGTQLMTVVKDFRELCKATIDAAIKLAKGEVIDIDHVTNNGKIDVPSLLITPIAVDKNNIQKVLIDSGYVKKEDVYKM